MDNIPLMMSAKHIQQLGFSRAAAYRMLNMSDMPVVRIGNRIYMHRDMFLEHLKKEASKLMEVQQENGAMQSI